MVFTKIVPQLALQKSQYIGTANLTGKEKYQQI